MTSQADILSRYQAIADISGRMLSEARANHWDAVYELGEQYHHAVETLRQELPVFEDPKNAGACKAAAKRAADQVEKAIDRLALDKDNRAYVFRSSMNAYIDRYFYGLKHNPKEQRRFDKETVRYNRTVSKGRFAPSVVPLMLMVP